jgi:tetratricopeptide (TPR) repeat protein
VRFYQRNLFQRIPTFLWLLTALAASYPMFAVPTPQADSDQLFTQAVQDYNQNRFSDAAAMFENVQGSHAQEAQQYIAKIKAYKDAMGVAKGIMDRSPDELDASSLEFAIQKYEDAIKIKPDGPWHPADELEKAKSRKAQIDQKHTATSKTMDRDFCQKAVEAKGQRHYKEAAQYACPLANDDPGYSCGGDEAVHMCEQMTELAKMDRSPAPQVQTAAGGASSLDKAQAAYEKNDFERARILFGLAPEDLRSTANEYLDKIFRYLDSMAQGEKSSKAGRYDEARTAFANAANIKTDGPGDPQAKALLMELAEGLDQFYSGDYASASQHLDTYARAGTEKQPMVHFYLGASKLARFFLTGSEDAGLRQDAMNDLKIAKQAGFKTEGQDVSPKIVQVYKDLTY